MKTNKGITLIALVITVVVLIILAAVTISLTLSNNGIFSRAKQGTEDYNKQAAIELINTKIADVQLEYLSKEKRLPTLQELADRFVEDDDIQYVELQTKVASLEPIIIGDNDSIYTKLKKYSFEFKIDNTLRIASIDGVEITSDVKEQIDVNNRYYIFGDSNGLPSYSATWSFRPIGNSYPWGFQYSGSTMTKSIGDTISYHNRRGSNSGGASAVLTTDSKINVSGYSKICIEGQLTNDYSTHLVYYNSINNATSGSAASGRDSYIAISKNLSNFDARTTYDLPECSQTDVYIGFYFSTYQAPSADSIIDFTANKIWLEK